MISDVLIKRNQGKFTYEIYECYPEEYCYVILYNESVYLRNYCISNKLNTQYEAGEIVKCLNKRYLKEE